MDANSKDGARRLEYLPLTELRGAARNPKTHADADIQTSINRFGYVEPMVVDERTGHLVAGHGRRDALMLLRSRGEAPPAGIKEDGTEWLVPVLRGWESRSDTEADAYLLASNKLTEAGGWNIGELTEMVAELDAADALDGVGFSDAELKKLFSTEAPSADGEVADTTDMGLRYQIIVDCRGEQHQAELMAKLEKEGVQCKPFIL